MARVDRLHTRARAAQSCARVKGGGEKSAAVACRHASGRQRVKKKEAAFDVYN